ncbi:putative porin [Alkalispirillum mobile]|uniref:Putative porin n=1 Tax=Alkalispirillum mobile TaxID=85925 RepID=A0A498C7R5_9GAMM|nr:porin [Alkalispirillum mobile]RLK51157.1 putative porin [Alkalispirillum mobile]
MKKIITFAAAAAMASPLAIATAAAGDLDIYGRVHMSVDHLDDRDESSQFLSSNGSRLGIRGSEYLGMGLTGIFQYEVAAMPTNNDDGLFRDNRTSYLGLQGDFGTILGGRIDDPLKTAIDQNQLFGDRLGDVQNLTSTPGNNTRHDNVLAYVTPEFEGFSGTFVYGPDQGVDKGDRFVVEGRYDNQVGAGNLFFSLAYLQANEGVVDEKLDLGFDEKHKVWQALASYSVADTWRVMALYQDYSSSDLFDEAQGDDGSGDDRVYGIGAGFHVAPQVELKAHVMHYDSDLSSDDSTMYALGADYYWTDRTTLYGVYSIMNNDSNAARDMSSFGRETGTGDEGTTVGADDNQWGLSVGIIHNF